MIVPSYDLFIAYASADAAAAEEVFDLLAPDLNVWLDTRSLLLGDEWPVEIPRAQRAALATVILFPGMSTVPSTCATRFTTAIALYRSFPGEHRVVAVYLDGRPSDPMQVPYGLRALHTLDAVAEGGLAGVARKLRDLVASSERAARPSRHRRSLLQWSSRRHRASLPGAALYDRLCKLTLGAQIDAVILRAGLPRQHIAPAPTSVAQRALDIVQIVGDDAVLAARVADAIAREAPWVRS